MIRGDHVGVCHFVDGISLLSLFQLDDQDSEYRRDSNIIYVSRDQLCRASCRIDGLIGFHITEGECEPLTVCTADWIEVAAPSDTSGETITD